VVSLNFWQTFVVFCKFVRVQGIFPNTSCIFVFTIATIFARDSRQQYRFMHKSNSVLNTLSSIANKSAALPLAMRFYGKYATQVPDAVSYEFFELCIFQ